MRRLVILFAAVVAVAGIGSYVFYKNGGRPNIDAVDALDIQLDLHPNNAGATARADLPFDVENPPNIVIIMADDLGWNDVGYHGSEIRTPNLDRLAAEGVELNRFYAHPTCSPTRASLMTGKSPVRLGIMAPLSKINPKGLPIEETTMAELLKERGYQTSLIGKWHLGGRQAAYLPNVRGFDYFYGNLMGGIGYWDHVHGGGYDLQRNGEIVREEGYVTHLTAREAVTVIEAREKDRPFFLFASFNAPHIPNEAPEETIQEYSNIEGPRRRVHAAMVTEFDDAVGQILATLESENILENTLIWFMSDNGGLVPKSALVNWLPDWAMEKATEKILGEDIEANPRFLEFSRIQLTQGASDNSPLQGGKTSLWEGGMRVPSIVYWKGMLDPSNNNEMIAMQDVLPTLLALSGDVPNPGTMDGRPVWPALTENAPLEPNPVVTASGPGAASFAVFVYPWKLVLEAGGNISLYNVQADPTETYELSQEYPNIAGQLTEYLQNFPRGENVALPYQDTVDDPDFFGGVEDREPWAETLLDNG